MFDLSHIKNALNVQTKTKYLDFMQRPQMAKKNPGIFNFNAGRKIAESKRIVMDI